MEVMFYRSYAFNQPANSWDVGQVAYMNHMFYYATSFNQPLDGWNVAKVIQMNSMLEATAFNQDISAWNVSRVTNMGSMLKGANALSGCKQRAIDLSFEAQVPSTWLGLSGISCNGLFLDHAGLQTALIQWCNDPASVVA